jgi:hypothetical protein
MKSHAKEDIEVLMTKDGHWTFRDFFQESQLE